MQQYPLIVTILLWVVFTGLPLFNFSMLMMVTYVLLRNRRRAEEAVRNVGELRRWVRRLDVRTAAIMASLGRPVNEQAEEAAAQQLEQELQQEGEGEATAPPDVVEGGETPDEHHP